MKVLVVQKFKNNAGRLANKTSVDTFEACKRRLRLYFSDLEEVKKRIIAGEIIDLPYLTVQRDKGENKKKKL